MGRLIKYDVDWIKNQDDFNSAFREVFYIINSDDDHNTHNAVMTSEFIITLMNKIGEEQTFAYLKKFSNDLLGCVTTPFKFIYVCTLIIVLKYANPITHIDENGVSHSRSETVDILKMIIDNKKYFDDMELKDKLIGFMEEIYDRNIITDGKFDFIIDEIEKSISPKSWMWDYITKVKDDRLCV